MKKSSFVLLRFTGLQNYFVSLWILGCCLTSFGLSAQTRTTYWWNDAVFYEVFVRSFKDSDGDGNGDLKGLLDQLDYLNDGDPSTSEDLGISGLWLMPVQQSPSYHGYDVTDYRTIEQDYGTNQDFKDLIAAAHARGIKVIIDLVMNHTSSQHPWFQHASSGEEAEKRNWYVWENPAPSMTGPWGQTLWYPKNGSNYYAVFWSEMPDLNYRTPAVQEAMLDVARFWLEDMHADGFRLDAVKYLFESGTVLEDAPETLTFWKDFRSYITSVQPDAFAVGEAWTSTDKVAPYVNDGGLHYCFEFDLASALVAAANSGNATALVQQMEEVIDTYPYLQYGTFLTNHDMNRVMDQLSGSTVKAKVAAQLLLTLPGISYLYYGEEIGMTGSGADENKRTPMQWNNGAQAGFTSGTPWRTVNANYTNRNVAAQQADPTSLWSTYQKMIALRNRETVLRRGDYKTVHSTETAVIAFLRRYENENLLIVCNTGSSALSDISLSLSRSEMQPGTYQATELLGDEGMTLTIDDAGSFSGTSLEQLPGRTARVYKLTSTGTTGVAAQQQQQQVFIYPLPADKTLNIRMPGLSDGPLHGRMTDLSGKTCMDITCPPSSGTYTISCEQLSAGTYLLHLSCNGMNQIERIVISK